jgi:uncharacterized protein (TIGR03790 family)
MNFRKQYKQMTFKQTLLLGIAMTAGTLSLRAAGPGDEVLVVYNSRMPESKSVADHYAQRRQVPTNQILGLELTTDEEISRTEFQDALQRPLAKALESRKLWHIASQIVPATNGQPGRVEWRVVNSRIRYLVLCYGVPLRITANPLLKERGMEKLRPELQRNEAAVDNELACLPWVEQKLPLSGPLPNQLYTVTNAALLHPTNGILLVARLDGPSADLARGLVDKAIQAETDGLWGRAYFDLRGLTDPAYKPGDDWIRTAAELSRLVGFETVIDTNAATFSTGFPMSHIGLYAGWYDNDASGPFSRPTVEFMPGAFAYHIQSYSAATLRSTTRNWVGPLLAKGVTATMGAVTEPYLSGTPDLGVFFGRFLFFGFTFGEAAYAAQPVLSWQTTVIGDPLYRPFGKGPQEQHLDLERRHSKLVEWSHLKVVNLNLAKNTPAAQLPAYLEEIETTKQSAVLTEKLADLYAALGKPLSAVRSYQAALKLDPSPQQRVRLRLVLGEKLQEQDRHDEAVENYRRLLEEAPDYPDRQAIADKLAALEAKAAQSAATNAPANP